MIELYSFYLKPVLLAILLDGLRDVWRKKSGTDITIIKSYISTRKVQQQSTLVRFRYRKLATALLPLIESLKEKHSAISELEKSRRNPLETVKKAGCTESVTDSSY